MAESILLPLIFAIIAPFIGGFMNVLDKFVVSHKVKNPLSFTVVAGIVNLAIGIIFSIFLNWNGISITNLVFPAAVGFFLGSQYFLYYYMLSKEDVSNVVGLVYLYPIPVAILSFLFLNEVLPTMSYLGVFLILAGVLMLSLKTGKIKLKIAVWMILLLVFNVALYEFFIKVATTTLPKLNGIATSHIFVGLVILLGLFNKKIRKGFPRELRNIKWAVLNESLTFLVIFTTYFAMAGLPATIVSSTTAIQPLAVLVLEFFANKVGINISRDKNFVKKAISIILIVLGVVLLYLPQLINLLK